MFMTTDLLLGVISFTVIVLFLVTIIIIARSQLVSSGEVNIEINGDIDNPIKVFTGNKLLQTLAENKIFLSSACGGSGTCNQCKCQVLEGAGSISPAITAAARSTCCSTPRRRCRRALSTPSMGPFPTGCRR